MVAVMQQSVAAVTNAHMRLRRQQDVSEGGSAEGLNEPRAAVVAFSDHQCVAQEAICTSLAAREASIPCRK